MDLKRVFAEGLLIGAGANLIADAISGHVKEKGYTNSHVLVIGLLFVGAFLLIWSAEHE